MNRSSLHALLLAAGLIALLLGCTLLVEVTPVPGATASLALTITPPAVRTPLPSTPTRTPAPPSLTPAQRGGSAGSVTPSPAAGNAGAGPSLTAGDVDIYPGPEHYTGDQISVLVHGHHVATQGSDVP